MNNQNGIIQTAGQWKIKEEFNVLSEFDGMSCGQLALQRVGKKVTNYFASEIDKYAIKVALKNFPNTKHLGDVTKIQIKDLPKIHLFIGGSPCQGFSFAGKQLNFSDPRSKLFFEFAADLRFIQEFINEDVQFFLENVKMKKEFQDVISRFLGVEPIFMDSNLVSAQNRKRLYWTNIEGFTIPEDKGILLKDILLDLPDCPIGISVRKKSNCIRTGGRNSPFGSKQIWDSPFQRISKKGKIKPGIEKSSCLTGGGNSGGNHSDMDIIHSEFSTRRYSTIECERLQTLPDNYTEGVSDSQRYKMLGNGWTAEAVEQWFKLL